MKQPTVDFNVLYEFVKEYVRNHDSGKCCSICGQRQHLAGNKLVILHDKECEIGKLKKALGIEATDFVS